MDPSNFAPPYHVGFSDGLSQAPAPVFPNPNVSNNPHIYMAVYSSVPVYEMMVRGVGVMRRRSDSYMNATQILKVAGVDKGKRTRILEKDINLGVHEKIQGGYGRYQGTWIPFHRAVDLAKEFGVDKLLEPLLEYTPPPGVIPGAPPIQRHQNGLKRQHDDDSPINSKRQRLATEDHESVYDMSAFAGSRLETVPQHLRILHSTKHPNDSSIGDDIVRTEMHRNLLARIFAPVGVDSYALGGLTDVSSVLPADIDPDTPIDDQKHTPMHWAAALARLPLVASLTGMGADVCRGNAQGETPLMRAVLSVNNYDADCFPILLESLGRSIRTCDDAGRTVLHHIALIAGVKGRAPTARYYIEGVLEYVARHEAGNFKELVDYQDVNGDTALNISARVGNRILVKALLDIGANKMIANKLGLKPGDFGIEEQDLKVTPGEDAIANIRGGVSSSVPVQKSRDVTANITAMIDSFSADFNLEIKSKSEALERVRVHLRSATRELSEQRKQLQSWKSKCDEVELRQQRIRNLERALREEESVDYTGRTEIDGTPSVGEPSFAYRGPNSILGGLPRLQSGISIEHDPPEPSMEDDTTRFIHLQRLEKWYRRILLLLSQRIQIAQDSNSDKESRYRSVISRFGGYQPDEVDGKLEGLAKALETDQNSAMGQVSSFVSKINANTYS
ncbi:apses-domain-containing protein [Atractiella rhizophila]|nr:apses-domain-containing protein [Atractiella rhizophila]